MLSSKGNVAIDKTFSPTAFLSVVRVASMTCVHWRTVSFIHREVGASARTAGEMPSSQLSENLFVPTQLGTQSG
jgi:hypothetical protein